MFSNVHFTLKFLPYQLYPNFPSGDGEDKYAWYRDEKYGGSEERMGMYTQLMSSYGEPIGIKFKFGGTIGNTLHAHRVVQYFQEHSGAETADKLINSLYRMYFEEEKHPSKTETLVAACKEAGIDEAEARKIAEDETEGLADVKSAIRESGLNGIDSVPYITIEGRKRDITLVGAKEVEQYAKALQTVAKESS